MNSTTHTHKITSKAHAQQRRILSFFYLFLRLDVTEQFDHVFWLGDLNFRIDLKIPAGRIPEGRTSQGGRSEGEIPGGRSEGEIPVGGRNKDEIPEGRIQQARIPEGRIPEGRTPDGRIPEGRRHEGETPEGALEETLLERWSEEKIPEENDPRLPPQQTNRDHAASHAQVLFICT